MTRSVGERWPRRALPASRRGGPIFCIVCGGEHEPAANMCQSDGMDEQIQRLGAQRWNRITAAVMRSARKRTHKANRVGSERMNLAEMRLAQSETEAALDVADIARDLVALWREQKIRALPRSERNAAIEHVRHRLCLAVDEWEAARRLTDSADRPIVSGVNQT